MGFSRDTFYRYQAAVESGGVEALIGANHRKPNPKNRVGEIAESAVTAFALEHPAFGQLRVSNELRKRGIFVSPSGVRSVWEIETAHPSYLGSQDTFCVGTIKGVGRIDQQTFRYLFQVSFGQAMHHQDANHPCRSAQ